MNSTSTWQKVEMSLQSQLPKTTFDKYFGNVSFKKEASDLFVIDVECEEHRAWLDARMTQTVERILTGITGRPVSVKFDVVRKALDAEENKDGGGYDRQAEIDSVIYNIVPCLTSKGAGQIE